MTRSMVYIITPLLAILLLIAAFYSYPYIDLQLPGSMHTEGVSLLSTSLDGHFNRVLFFSINAALVPLAIVLIWSIGNMNDARRRALCAMIIIVCTIAGFMIRYFLVKWSMSYSASHGISPNVKNMVDINSFLFERYMLYGLLAGMLISYLSLRKKKIAPVE